MSAQETERQLAEARAIIEMLQSELLETNRGLIALSMELEDRVQERTRELAYANAGLRAAKEEAERANGAKSLFVASISHDLRQPLAALALYVGTLKNKLAPEDASLGASMKECVDNLSEMLSNLLDLSRLDAGVVKPNVVDFSLSETLAKVVSSHSPAAEAKGIALRLRDMDVVGRTDPVLFQRILGNLLSNAIRYTERGGVLIGCRRRSGKVIVEVWDTGVGIPADKTEEIFEEFKQLGNQERNATKGTGLGLAIVAKKAALLGLGVRVRSRPGRGSVFGVDLPLGKSVRQAPARRYAHRPVHVALVDDNVAVGTALSYALGNSGHQVTWGTSLEDLLSRLGSAVPDIAISDYRLAGSEDGFDVVAALRRRYRADLPAIVITGDTDPSVIRRLHGAGVPVQHKPVDLETLRARIAELTSVPVAGRAAR